jgi:hypothetical protein
MLTPSFRQERGGSIRVRGGLAMAFSYCRSFLGDVLTFFDFFVLASCFARATDSMLIPFFSAKKGDKHPSPRRPGHDIFVLMRILVRRAHFKDFLFWPRVSKYISRIRRLATHLNPDLHVSRGLRDVDFADS